MGTIEREGSVESAATVGSEGTFKMDCFFLCLFLNYFY